MDKAQRDGMFIQAIFIPLLNVPVVSDAVGHEARAAAGEVENPYLLPPYLLGCRRFLVLAISHHLPAIW